MNNATVGEIAKAIGENIKLENNSTLTILEGNAPTQHNLQKVSISGNVDSASRFIKSRSEDFNWQKSHCLVSTEQGYVNLVVNEQDACDNYTISGKLELAKDFKDLGINTGKVYSPLDLADKFRLKRSIFPSFEEHANICATLKSLKARVDRQIEQSEQDNGNKTYLFNQTVESNMPKSFNLNLPLIKGQKAETIEVQVILQARNNSIECYLSSVEGQEKLDKTFEESIMKEVDFIQEKVLVIFQ